MTPRGWTAALAAAVVGLLPAHAAAQARAVPRRDPPKSTSPPKKTDASTSQKARLDPNGPPLVYDHRGHGSSSGGSGPGGTVTGGSSFGEVETWPGLPDWRSSFEVGGHLALPDANLAPLTAPVGGGLDATFLLSPPHWPVLFGFQTGFDTFGSVTRTFQYASTTDSYALKRNAYWFHGLVRLEPEWKLRPHLDLFGGFWLVDVSVGLPEGASSPTGSTSFGTAVTGSYGAGVGLRYVANSGFSLDLSVIYMRGGGMTLPDTANSTCTSIE
jgi:hypothetical protein